MEELHYEYDDAPVNKAALRAKVEQKLIRRRAEGEALEAVLPVVKKELCTSFWGQAWNKNLMLYADYESRMAPARTALRRGEILDLKISSGRVVAVAAGLDVYDVMVRIRPLDEELWAEIRADCAGQVSTLVELLSGQLSKAVMQRVTVPELGLFPTGSEIRASCSCPDDARLCMHAAAALYGVSILLDAQPGLLFTLRGVDAAELINMSASDAVDGLVAGAVGDLGAEELGDVFGIDLKG
jgi:uncharacterized Zn finger protein